MSFFPLLAIALLAQPRQPVAELVSFDRDSAERVFPGFRIESVDDGKNQSNVAEFLGHTFARYPAESLMRELRSVFVVRRMWWKDVEFGGTHNAGEGGIILSPSVAITDESWTDHTFHHELAHLIMARHGAEFPRAEWTATNAQAYGHAADANGGYAALVNGEVGTSFVPALNDVGLLSTYGSASFDEDWACYGEAILSDDPAFWSLVAKYPRVRAKARMAIDFYRKIFPGVRLPDA